MVDMMLLMLECARFKGQKNCIRLGQNSRYAGQAGRQRGALCCIGETHGVRSGSRRESRENSPDAMTAIRRGHWGSPGARQGLQAEASSVGRLAPATPANW